MHGNSRASIDDLKKNTLLSLKNMKLSDKIKIVSFNVNQGIIRYRREQRFVKKKNISGVRSKIIIILPYIIKENYLLKK